MDDEFLERLVDDEIGGVNPVAVGGFQICGRVGFTGEVVLEQRDKFGGVPRAAKGGFPEADAEETGRFEKRATVKERRFAFRAEGTFDGRAGGDGYDGIVEAGAGAAGDERGLHGHDAGEERIQEFGARHG